MDQDTSNSVVSAMEVQLHWLLKNVNDATDAIVKEMKKSTQEWFIKVRAKLDSIYNFILK